MTIFGLEATEPPIDPGTADEVNLGAPGGLTERTCAHCGTSIEHRHARTMYCSDRCWRRDRAGLPVVPATPRARTYHTKLDHPGYVVEACPACDFPEADGGYCPDCGWTSGARSGPGWTDNRQRATARHEGGS